MTAREMAVSTHSRLKAAGRRRCTTLLQYWGFNTQPPEGGWAKRIDFFEISSSVSTHSRLKAAGLLFALMAYVFIVSTHSRLKAAGTRRGR